MPYENIVKGYEIAQDRYVVIEPGELEALAPKKTKTIEIEDFVELAQIDPIYYDHPYYLAPGPGGAKPYRLLLDAMSETGKVAIARVVIRSKEQLVALRPMGDALGMATMIFADEVLPPDSLDEIDEVKEVKTTKRELDIAKQLVESLGGRLRARQVHRLLPRAGARHDRAQGPGRADRRAAGAEDLTAPAPDLMGALKASLEAVRAREGEDGAKPKAAKRKAPAKKSRPKRAHRNRRARKARARAPNAKREPARRRHPANPALAPARARRPPRKREEAARAAGAEEASAAEAPREPAAPAPAKKRRGQPRASPNTSANVTSARRPSPRAGAPADGRADGLPRFVIHQHSARRLHWDLRLEHEGVLASWAVPKGMPEEPGDNRFAAHTEDHPIEYLDFHGEIPKGNYGAGEMTIWDHGTYELPEVGAAQGRGGAARRAPGRALRAVRDRQGGPAEGLDGPPHGPARGPRPRADAASGSCRCSPAPPPRCRPTIGWGFEIKWDGVRAIAYCAPGEVRLESRNLKEITDSYPELGRLDRALGSHHAVLDGEIVAFDERGAPELRPPAAAHARRLARAGAARSPRARRSPT